MIGPVVTGHAVASPVLLIGQAPGIKEGRLGRPFAWTAGKTLFQWFGGIGLDEERFRHQVYMAAMCRCFPGKNPKGGDRAPSRREIAHCDPWLRRELELLKPRLILPVGKLAISRFIEFRRLTEVIGARHRVQLGVRAGGKAGVDAGIDANAETGTETGVDAGAHRSDLIPLPHPSGVSTWHRTEPGRTLLQQALALIAAHPAWQQLRELGPPSPGKLIPKSG